MKKYLSTGFLISLLCGLTAKEVPPVSSFQDMALSSTNPVVFFENFEEKNLSRWHMPAAVKIEAGEGLMGTHALVLSRTKENVTDYERARVYCDVKKLTPGKFYRLSASYRNEGVKAGLRVGTFISMQGDRDTAGVYPNKFPSNSTKWETTSFVFRAGDLNRLTLCLWWDVTGKAYWDDIRIEEFNSNNGTMYTRNHALRLDEKGTVEIRGTLWGKNDLTPYSVILETSGRRLMQSFDKSSNAKFFLGRLANGTYPCKAYLVDLKSKKILVKYSFTLFRDAAAKPIHGSMQIAKNGIPMLNGKPFLPIGTFIGEMNSEAVLKRLAEGGFNFVLHYRSFDLNIHKGFGKVPDNPDAKKRPGKPDPKRDSSPEWIAQVRSSLDLLQKYHIKYIPTWGGEPPAFQHKAVIARYTADEVPATAMPQLGRQRERISKRNPFHPVIALTNRPLDLPAYAQVADVVGIDKYPVEGKNDKSRSMVQLRYIMTKAQEIGIHVMFVPQAFNWGAYRPAKNYKNFSYPTEEEIRSMTLLPAILGVRWFCFYSYDPIWGEQEKRDPGSSKHTWKSLTNVVSLLHSLEPWLLSAEPPRDIKIENRKKPVVDAKLLRAANGKLCVLVTACGPADSEAILSVGKNGLKSKYGRTVPCGNGKYRFTGKGISSDVLIEP